MDRIARVIPALVAGGMIAAGAVTLAARGPATRPGPPTPADEPPPASAPGVGPWKKTLPGGATVELIGIAADPEEMKSWWRPDGTPLGRLPFLKFTGSVGEAAGYRPRVFAYRVTGARESSVLFEIPGSSAGSAGAIGYRGFDTKVDNPAGGFIAKIPEGTRSGTIRIGVADAPWQTEMATDGARMKTSEVGDGWLVFTKARPLPDGVAIVLSSNRRGDPDRRVVAVDREGHETMPWSGTTNTQGPIRVRDMEFRLDPASVLEFRAQSRPYAWVEFRDVPFEPAPPEP